MQALLDRTSDELEVARHMGDKPAEERLAARFNRINSVQRDRFAAAQERRAAIQAGRLWTAYIVLYRDPKAFCLLRNEPRDELYVSALASQHPDCTALMHVEIIADDQHKAMCEAVSKVNVDEITLRVSK